MLAGRVGSNGTRTQAEVFCAVVCSYIFGHLRPNVFVLFWSEVVSGSCVLDCLPEAGDIVTLPMKSV